MPPSSPAEGLLQSQTSSCLSRLNLSAPRTTDQVSQMFHITDSRKKIIIIQALFDTNLVGEVYLRSTDLFYIPF